MCSTGLMAGRVVAHHRALRFSNAGAAQTAAEIPLALLFCGRAFAMRGARRVPSIALIETCAQRRSRMTRVISSTVVRIITRTFAQRHLVLYRRGLPMPSADAILARASLRQLLPRLVRPAKRTASSAARNNARALITHSSCSEAGTLSAIVSSSSGRDSVTFPLMMDWS